jgi:hypothetical protein
MRRAGFWPKLDLQPMPDAATQANDGDKVMAFQVGQPVWIFDRHATEVPVFHGAIRYIMSDGEILVNRLIAGYQPHELYESATAAHTAAAKHYQQLADRHERMAKESEGR